MPHSAVRLGVAMDATPTLMQALERDVVPQTVGHEMHLCSHRRFLAKADQMGVLWPWSVAGARHVGRALNLTHVAIFEATPGEEGTRHRARLHLRLLDVRTGKISINKRYALPGGQLPQISVPRIVASLRYMLLGERHPAPPKAPGGQSMPVPQSSPSDPEYAASMGPDAGARKLERDDQTKTRAPATPQEQSAASPTAASTETSDAILAQQTRASSTKSRFSARLGLALTYRNAQLSAPGAPGYGGAGGFVPGSVGPAFASALFFDPNITRFGVRLAGTVGVASQQLGGDAAGQNGQTLPWSVQGDVAYRLADSPPLAVIPHLGAAYSRFAVAHGPFVGTAYTSVYGGVGVQTHSLGGHFVWRTDADFHVIAHCGLEAVRLGAYQDGTGWQVQAGPTVVLGGLKLGLEARFSCFTTHYTGSTALYESTRYVNVSLNDATLGLQVWLGGGLW